MQVVHETLGTVVAVLTALVVIFVGALALATVVFVMWPAAVALDAIERKWIS